MRRREAARRRRTCCPSSSRRITGSVRMALRCARTSTLTRSSSSRRASSPSRSRRMPWPLISVGIKILKFGQNKMGTKNLNGGSFKKSVLSKPIRNFYFFRFYFFRFPEVGNVSIEFAIGQTDLQMNKNAIRVHGCDILCCTPGRFFHLLNEHVVSVFLRSGRSASFAGWKGWNFRCAALFYNSCRM